MDIHSWLEKTADREPPEQPEHPTFPDAPPHATVKHVGKRHRKRKRASSDSSLLVLQQPHHERARTPNRAHSSDDVRHDAGRHVGRSGRRRRSSAESQEGQRAAKTYEKRARHKTKPDRYEAKTKTHQDEVGPREGTKRRKSHRSGDGGRTTGLVQSFHLKNGPKSSRLTLKPDVNNAGLFKHGRASAQVVGRGAALPDPVFNEMRFLQKPKDHQDEPAAGHGRTRTKKDDKRKREEGISAYFAQDVHAEVQPPKTDAEPGASRKAHQPRQFANANQGAIGRPGDSPGKPYLGSSTKDRHMKARPKSPTSYYSWSESIEHGATVEPSASGQHVGVGRQRALRTKHDAEYVGVGSLEQGIHQDHLTRERHSKHLTSAKPGKWSASRRATGPVVEDYKPPEEHDQRPGARSTHKSTLQSLPQAMPSEPPVAALERGRDLSSSGTPSHHTSDILRIRCTTERATLAREDHPTDDTIDQLQRRGKENQPPRSSTPISKLLRKAQHAVAERPPNYSVEQSTLPSLLNVTAITRQASPPPHASQRARRLSTEAWVGPRLPERTLQPLSGIRPRHDRRESPRDRAPLSRTRPTHQQPILRTADSRAFDLADDEGEMLDHARADPHAGQHVYANAQQAEDFALADRMASQQAAVGYDDDEVPNVYHTQAEFMLSEAAVSHIPSGSISAPSLFTPIGALTTGRDVLGEGSAGLSDDGQEAESEDALAGFWRRNRLY
ncbi:hypothetical protein LTR53_012156 [Teratosphaeriaceae sp. CCFEE 6253]|nr:hypothetical protein LTR53_012156 [Teratosphaeriaceae sp. CCFEE 6253]